MQPLHEKIFFLYPVSDINGRVPVGASEYNSLHILLRGNITAGGTQTPEPLKQQTTETGFPRSADTILPTILLPFSAVTLGNLMGTVEMPLSSRLKILFGGKLCFSKTARKLSKICLLELR
jgi:hypothetical protein